MKPTFSSHVANATRASGDDRNARRARCLGLRERLEIVDLPPPSHFPFDNSQALGFGEGCAQAAGGCQVRARRSKTRPACDFRRAIARAWTRTPGAARGHARTRPRSALDARQSRTRRLRGIRSRARRRCRGDTAARDQGSARSLFSDDGRRARTRPETLTFFSSRRNQNQTAPRRRR